MCLSLCPYSTTCADSKQDIYLPTCLRITDHATRATSKIICPNPQMAILSPRKLTTVRILYIYIIFGNYKVNGDLLIIAKTYHSVSARHYLNYFMVLNPYLRFRITITITTREMKRVTESHRTCWWGAGLHIQSVWPQRPLNYPAHSLS